MNSSGKYILVTLIIGWFLGAASGLLIARAYHEHAQHSGRNRERFYRKLELTPEQRAKADVLLQASRQKIDQIFADVRPKIEDIRNVTRKQFREMLTPDQQTKFDKMNARWRAKFEKRIDQLQETLGGTTHQ